MNLVVNYNGVSGRFRRPKTEQAEILQHPSLEGVM